MKSTTFFLAPVVLLLVVSLLSIALGGCAAESTLNDENQVRATVTALQQPGSAAGNLVLVWRFDIAEGWHLYWPGRNDSGFPPTVELALPAGWTAGELQWPAPERHLSEGEILDHVYYGELVVLQEITVPEAFDLSDGFEITGEVSWLACKGMCVPGDAVVAITEIATARADFDQAQERLPRAWDQDILQVRWDAATLYVTGPEGAQLTFIPDNDCGRLVDLIADGEGETLAVRFRPEAGVAGPARGLITIKISGAPLRSYFADLPAVSLVRDSPGG